MRLPIPKQRLYTETRVTCPERLFELEAVVILVDTRHKISRQTRELKLKLKTTLKCVGQNLDLAASSTG